MSPAEVALIIDAKRPREINGIHENDYARMMERRQELIEQGLDVL